MVARDDVPGPTAPAVVAVHTLADRGLLVDCADLDAVLALHGALDGLRRRATTPAWEAVTDLVPAARTLLVVTRPGTSPDALRQLAAELSRARPGPGEAPTARAGREIRIPVVYDGPDLDEVARLTGLDPADVVRAHAATPWRAAFGGFAPGFCYLDRGDPRLDVPRRATPRTRVPAGAVGLAGPFSGVYPRESPGGWQLVGRTDAVLWDEDRTPPALVRPGDTVRFVAVEP